MIEIKKEEFDNLIESCLFEIIPQVVLRKKDNEIKKLKEEVKSLKDKYEKTIWYVLGPTKQ